MPPVTLEREKEIVSSMAPFTIEVDHPTNSDVLLQGIPGCRLRSAITANRPIKDKDGEFRVPRDMSIDLGQLPPIPGQRLAVNPAKCSYRITDPLAENEDLCERIRKAMDRNRAFRVDGKLRGVETQMGTIDKHRMKTLCRELLWLVDAGEAKIVSGVKPSLEDITALPGEFLLNPGSMVRNSQPRYEKDLEPWVDRLTRGGD